MYMYSDLNNNCKDYIWSSFRKKMKKLTFLQFPTVDEHLAIRIWYVHTFKNQYLLGSCLTHGSVFINMSSSTKLVPRGFFRPPKRSHTVTKQQESNRQRATFEAAAFGEASFNVLAKRDHIRSNCKCRSYYQVLLNVNTHLDMKTDEYLNRLCTSVHT